MSFQTFNSSPYLKIKHIWCHRCPYMWVAWKESIAGLYSKDFGREGRCKRAVVIISHDNQIILLAIVGVWKGRFLGTHDKIQISWFQVLYGTVQIHRYIAQWYFGMKLEKKIIIFFVFKHSITTKLYTKRLLL